MKFQRTDHRGGRRAWTDAASLRGAVRAAQVGAGSHAGRSKSRDDGQERNDPGRFGKRKRNGEPFVPIIMLA